MVQTSEVCVENIDNGITCEDKQKLIQETRANPEQQENVVSEIDFEKAIKLYQQGKKDLLLSKYDDAVSNIADACKIYSSKYGELASECADIYFYYGKSLLELARVENTVLGNALNGVPEESEPFDDSRYGNPETVPEAEREDIAEQVLDAMCDTDGEVKKDGENGTAEAKPDEAPETAATIEKPVETKSEGDVEKAEVKGETKEETKEEKCENSEKTIEEKKEENVEEKKVEEKKAEEKKEGNNEEEKKEEKEKDEAGVNEEEKIEVDEDENENDGEDKEEDVGGEENDEDDVTNLQQAWEMFELAKLIYTKYYKEKDDEDKYFKIKRVCECLLKLGEVSIEQEQFDQAINDIKESIKTQETEITGENIDKRDERLLAESYYQLALAYQFSNKCDLAKESHNKATNILLILVEKLKAKLAQIGESKGDDDFEKKQLNEEINELELLIPQMCAKLEEINEQGQQEEQQINIIKEAAKECFLSAANAAANGASSSDQVKDITNSIKSKRKLSSSSENLDKKMKTENGECAVEANGGEEKSTTNGEVVATENSGTPNGNNVEIVS